MEDHDSSDQRFRSAIVYRATFTLTAHSRVANLDIELLKLLRETSDEFRLLLVAEVTRPREIRLLRSESNIIQIEGPSIQTNPLLASLGTCERPVFLKRGFMMTLQEFGLCAESILLHGNPQVMLGESGIRSFRHDRDLVFDIKSIPLLKTITHLSTIADPRYGTDQVESVAPVALAAAVVAHP